MKRIGLLLLLVVLVSGSVLAQNKAMNLDDGLVIYMPFDEGNNYYSKTSTSL